MFLNLMDPRVKNKKISLKKNSFANMVSDKKKNPLLAVNEACLINVFSVSDVLLI